MRVNLLGTVICFFLSTSSIYADWIGRGLKSVKIDISRDYQNWRTIFEGGLNKATEIEGMLCTDTIPCDESTRYVVINGFSHWDTSTGILDIIKQKRGET